MMDKKATPVDTYLYTTEAFDSRQKVEEELKVADPDNERAIATITGGVKKDPKGNEQKAD